MYSICEMGLYTAYNHGPGLKQRCWAHLLRDIHKLKALHPEDAGLARVGTEDAPVLRPSPVPGRGRELFLSSAVGDLRYADLETLSIRPGLMIVTALPHPVASSARSG